MQEVRKGLLHLAVKSSCHLSDMIVSVSETLMGRRLCRRVWRDRLREKHLVGVGALLMPKAKTKPLRYKDFYIK